MKSSSLSGAMSVASVALEAEIDECHQRLLSNEINFNALQLGGCGHQGAKEMATSPFTDAFESELHRTSDALRNLRCGWFVEDACEHEKSACEKELGRVQGQAKSLQLRVLALKRVTRQNANELNRIALEADYKLGTSAVAEAERFFAKEPWADDVSSGHIVILLSDIFSILRDVEDAGKEKDGKWVAPSSFERVTTKYWVLDQNLPEVLLKSVSELPLLVYGRSGLLQDNPKNPTKEGELWQNMAAPISSVYFDSANMDLYKERIKRSEGAQLFRVRWYGDKPKGDEQIFLELKTHHECWVDNKSIKERVALKERDMPKLIDTSDGLWSIEYATELVREASPDDKDEAISEAAALLVEIRSIICKFKLRPCVRTKYNRAAFQSAKNNNLRLTIDRDITVIDETCNNASDGSWCLDEHSIIPINAVVKVPYGVFEVKVSGGEDPLFIEELIECGAIAKANKFSKFLTGGAIHNAATVNMLPWWADDPLFAPLFKKPKRRSSAVVTKRSMNKQDNAEVSPAVEQAPDDAFIAAEEGRGTSYEAQGKVKVGLRQRLKGKKEDSPTIAPRSPARVEPKSFFANERTFIQWVSAALLLMTVAELLFASARDSVSKSALIAGNFMMAVALVVIVYAIVLFYRRLYLMSNSKPYGYADTIGPFVFAVFIITGISLIIWWTNTNFDFPQPTLTQQEGVCVKRHLGGDINMLQFEPSDLTIDEKKGLLLVASLNEIIAIPDGLSTSKEDVKILYRSQNGENDFEAIEIIDEVIYAVSEASQINKRSDVVVFGAEAEGRIVPTSRYNTNTPMVEGMAYISSPNWFPQPRLVLAGLASDHSLRMNTYDFPLPGNSPVENPITLTSTGLNDKIFSRDLGSLDLGLSSRQKVAAMQYFDGLLYLLFDNAMLIRAFDSYGTMIQETKLPVAVEGFEKQWEGMELQRKDGDLILHLALDSPPQVWSLKLESVQGGAGWKLPPCAT